MFDLNRAVQQGSKNIKVSLQPVDKVRFEAKLLGSSITSFYNWRARTLNEKFHHVAQAVHNKQSDRLTCAR